MAVTEGVIWTRWRCWGCGLADLDLLGLPDLVRGGGGTPCSRMGYDEDAMFLWLPSVGRYCFLLLRAVVDTPPPPLPPPRGRAKGERDGKFTLQKFRYSSHFFKRFEASGIPRKGEQMVTFRCFNPQDGAFKQEAWYQRQVGTQDQRTIPSSWSSQRGIATEAVSQRKRSVQAAVLGIRVLTSQPSSATSISIEK